uniref:Reverse transcriptase domain-containing protein n=2 Tax=Aegilops tauschii subsp. strangulata TaxID=200361 RepID=A0A453EZI2_AEGTS
MKAFSPKWISWMKSFVSGGSVAIKINDDVGPYVQTKKGLLQGDPLFIRLFNIVSAMLAVLIDKAKADEQISGVMSHLVDGGLSILQYDDLRKAHNKKILLCAFEQLSGLTINFHKSELFCFGQAQTMENIHRDFWLCLR